MASSPAEDRIARFVLVLLHTECWLNELVPDLSTEVTPDAHPGEEPGSVVVEMLGGTIAAALLAADPREVERATEPIELAGARTREHWRLARDLARRAQGEDGGVGRTYG